MTFQELCAFRDTVIEVSKLADKYSKESNYKAISGLSYEQRSKNTMPGDPTAKKAMKLAELSARLDSKKKILTDNVKRAEALIDQHCEGEPKAAKMMKLYFLYGYELWQVKKWTDENDCSYDPGSTLVWFSKRVLQPGEREFYNTHGRLPEPGEL